VLALDWLTKEVAPRFSSMVASRAALNRDDAAPMNKTETICSNTEMPNGVHGDGADSGRYLMMQRGIARRRRMIRSRHL